MFADGSGDSRDLAEFTKEWRELTVARRCARPGVPRTMILLLLDSSFRGDRASAALFPFSGSTVKVLLVRFLAAFPRPKGVLRTRRDSESCSLAASLCTGDEISVGYFGRSCFVLMLLLM